MNRKVARTRRAKKTRSKIKELNMPSLSVHRTPKNIYAQIILPGGKIAASACTLGADIKKECAYGGNIKAAVAVGKAVAVKAKESGVDKVSFDRSGFRYHGRIKALADSARENGLEF